jgi:3-phosphoshikimate 1-carboxyvinyltransferase
MSEEYLSVTAVDAPTSAASSLAALPSDRLRGNFRVPGDKSISHRALMFGALAVGETRIEGLLEGEDVLRTAAALRALGAEVERLAPGSWRVVGRGVGGFAEPDDVLDFGNAGTGARLMLGLLAGQPITSFLTGDASLRSRPMGRVMQPLQRMGVSFVSREGGRLPLAVAGPSTLLPIEYSLPVPSAQVKSALLLAGLAAPGQTVVIEPEPTRDHSERMLRHFGAEVFVDDRPEGREIRLTGQPELAAAAVSVPADPSSAAFPAVAALLLPDSEVRLEGVCLNPLRDGIYRTLLEMGADITEEDRRLEAGETIADLVVRSSRLQGIEVPPERAASMIDEYPVLAVAAACAEGSTIMRGLAELRVKESDRLAGIAKGLAACGVEVEEGPDSLVVHGRGGRPRGGATLEAALDHRMAMSFLVLGLASEQPVIIDDASPIGTSFPGFVPSMEGLGARFRQAPLG